MIEVEISDLERRDIVLSMGRNKDADKLCSYCITDLHLYFHLCILMVFLCGGSDDFVTDVEENQVKKDILLYYKKLCIGMILKQ